MAEAVSGMRLCSWRRRYGGLQFLAGSGRVRGMRGGVSENQGKKGPGPTVSPLTQRDTLRRRRIFHLQIGQ